MNNIFKKVGFSMLGLLCCHAGASQTHSMSLGLEGGVNFENAATPAQISSSTRTGFMAGVNLEFGLSEVFSLQPEFLFSQRGSNLVDAGGVKLTAKFNSIEVPVLLKAGFGEKVRPYLFAGPVAIFNVSKSVDADVLGATTSFQSNPRTVNFAADFGVGLEAGPFFTNLRYSLGLLDIDETHADWKSRGFQALIGIKI